MSAGTRPVRTHGSGCVAEQQGKSAASSSRSKTPAREYPVWADCPAWGRERRESTTVSGWPACASGCTRSVDGWTSNRKSDGRSSPPSSLTPTAPDNPSLRCLSVTLQEPALLPRGGQGWLPVSGFSPDGFQGFAQCACIECPLL